MGKKEKKNNMGPRANFNLVLSRPESDSLVTQVDICGARPPARITNKSPRPNIKPDLSQSESDRLRFVFNICPWASIPQRPLSSLRIFTRAPPGKHIEMVEQPHESDCFSNILKVTAPSVSFGSSSIGGPKCAGVADDE